MNDEAIGECDKAGGNLDASDAITKKIDTTRAKLKVEGDYLHSFVNDKSHGIGDLNCRRFELFVNARPPKQGLSADWRVGDYDRKRLEVLRILSMGPPPSHQVERQFVEWIARF